MKVLNQYLESAGLKTKGKIKLKAVIQDENLPRVCETIKVQSSKDVVDLVKPLAEQEVDIMVQECFIALYLTRGGKYAGHQVFIGGINSTIADIRLIVAGALMLNASSLILTHNHPSGTTIISEADKRITSNIKEACKYFDLALLDHVILCPTVNQTNYPERCFHISFADEGELY